MGEIPASRLLAIWAVVMIIVMAVLGSTAYYCLEAGYFTGTLRVLVVDHGTYPYDDLDYSYYSYSSYNHDYMLYVDGEMVESSSVNQRFWNEVAAVKQHEIWVVNEYGLESNHLNVSVDFRGTVFRELDIGNLTMISATINLELPQINYTQPVNLYLDGVYFDNRTVQRYGLAYDMDTATFMVPVEFGGSYYLRVEYMGFSSTTIVDADDWEVTARINIF